MIKGVLFGFLTYLLFSSTDACTKALGGSLPISPYVTTISFLIYVVCRITGNRRLRRGWARRTELFQPPAAEDVLQEVLKSVAASLKNFRGDTLPAFRSWFYTIARNRLNDHFRQKKSDRLQPIPNDELLDLLYESEQSEPMTAADRHDLEYALKLLDGSKPECRGYLWNHYVIGFDYGEIAEEQNLNYDNVRMKIGRCLDEAKSLVA